jgi:hypothetical protein
VWETVDLSYPRELRAQGITTTITGPSGAFAAADAATTNNKQETK